MKTLIRILLAVVMFMIFVLMIVIFAKITLWCGTGGALGFWKHWWNVPVKLFGN